MSFARAPMASTYPYALSPDDPAAPPAPPAGGTPPAPPAPPTPPAPPAPPAGGAQTPPAPPTPGAPPTLAGGGGAPVVPVAATAKFPETWRDDLAGGDAEYRKRLDRFDSPAALAKSYRELETKVSSGQLKPPAAAPPGKDAKPEEVAAWRKEQGLPEKPDDYVANIALPNGLVPAETDKPLLNDLAKVFHDSNLPPALYNQLTGWYLGKQQEMLQARANADKNYMLEGDLELAREWGGERDRNRAMLSNFWAKYLPKDLADAMTSARLPNGVILGNHPGLTKGWLEIAKTINPAAAVLPAGSNAGPADLDGRINEIGKMMKDPAGPYWRGDTAPKLQEEYRNLVTAREQLKERTRAA